MFPIGKNLQTTSTDRLEKHHGFISTEKELKIVSVRTPSLVAEANFVALSANVLQP